MDFCPVTETTSIWHLADVGNFHYTVMELMGHWAGQGQDVTRTWLQTLCAGP